MIDLPSVKQRITTPSGEELELYYIGTLAYELGRTPNTIRKWEIGGIIPDPCFRDTRDRRLYSREQINIIVACAEKAGIKQGKSISNTTFSQKVHEQLAKVQERYMKSEVAINE